MLSAICLWNKCHELALQETFHSLNLLYVYKKARVYYFTHIHKLLYKIYLKLIKIEERQSFFLSAERESYIRSPSVFFARTDRYTFHFSLALSFLLHTMSVDVQSSFYPLPRHLSSCLSSLLPTDYALVVDVHWDRLPRFAFSRALLLLPVFSVSLFPAAKWK